MTQYYPVLLSLTGKRCVVVGGGKVAERKVGSLLDAGAGVVVISPQLIPQLQALEKERRIQWLARAYRPGDLAGKPQETTALVISATPDAAVNEQVAEEANHLGIPVNVVDKPELCSFIVPSSITRGELQISISTGGRSPALAKKLRRDLEKIIGHEYAEYLELLGEVRERVLLLVPEQSRRRQIFQELVCSDILQLIKDKQPDRITELLRRIIPGY